MIAGQLRLKICGLSACCEFHPGWNIGKKVNFRRDAIDRFKDESLKDCQNYYLDQLRDIEIENWHYGSSNGWQGDFIEVNLNNGSKIFCNLTVLDDDTSYIENKELHGFTDICKPYPSDQTLYFGRISAFVTKTANKTGAGISTGSLRLIICGPRANECCETKLFGNGNHFEKLGSKDVFQYPDLRNCNDYELSELAHFVALSNSPDVNDFWIGDYIEVHFVNETKLHCNVSTIDFSDTSASEDKRGHVITQTCKLETSSKEDLIPYNPSM